MTDEERQKLCERLRNEGKGTYQAADEIERLQNELIWTKSIVQGYEQRDIDRLAQSDAEPWRCPIGISPESHGLCSAGTCWWCLADRMKAPPRPDASARLIEVRDMFRRKAHACIIEFKKTADPAAASAAYAYTEAAGELERIRDKAKEGTE